MADNEQPQSFFQKLTDKQKIAAGLGGLALVAALALSGLYSGSTEYKVLFSNVADRDGGAIVAALDTMHVPYKFSDGGGAIMVPSEFVHEARLKLASQGLPKGGSVGFELMENQKFGISHFAEHINYQRGLEGELARTISSIQYVSGARVHLSIPKQTVFVKDTMQPSASVFLSVMQGRNLDKSQIIGIANLVSSAVPNLKPSQVTIVDQSGVNLHGADNPADNMLDGRQLDAQRKIEADYSREIEAILEPVVGRGNVRAKVRVELDLGKVEQTEEIYGPNTDSTKAAIRSTQSMESNSGGSPVGGIPGSVSNTPPGSGSAPDQLSKPSLPPLPSFATNGNKSSTTNYEVDRIVRHTKKATGSVVRLSVAVLLNNKNTVGADGKAVSTPLTTDEISRATKLVQDVVGYKADRGDSVEVANIEFIPTKVEDVPALPMWQDPEMQSLAGSVGKGLGMLLAILYLLFGVARPMMKKVLTDESSKPVPAGALAQSSPEAEGGASASISEQAMALSQQPVSELDLAKRKASELASASPDAAATVVKKWVESEGA